MGGREARKKKQRMQTGEKHILLDKKPRLSAWTGHGMIDTNTIRNGREQYEIFGS